MVVLIYLFSFIMDSSVTKQRWVLLHIGPKVKCDCKKFSSTSLHDSSGKVELFLCSDNY